MKKLLLTLTLVAAVVSAYGQGAVAFSNGTLSRLSTDKVGGGALAQVPLTSGLLEYGLFYGIGQSTSLTFLTSQLGVNSTTGLGIIASPSDQRTALSIVSLPGTSPAESDIWVQMAGWSASYGSDYATAHNAFNAATANAFWGATAVRNINNLGNPTVSGVAIWAASTSTNLRTLPAIIVYTNVPEPTTLAFVGLGAAALLIFRRRS